MSEQAAKYCQQCGAELAPASNFCPDCGTEMRMAQRSNHDANTVGRNGSLSPAEQDIAPMWPPVVLSLCWLAVVWGVVQFGYPSVTFGLISLLAIGLSLPLLYVDARNAKRTGELDIKYPVGVPIAVMLLWGLALPIYLGYRWLNRKK
jgi:hypothetical protein